MKQAPSLNYKQSGVDIDAGNQLVKNIKSMVQKTYRPEVQTSLGGFSGACAIPKNYKNPILISATDGVGSKLKFAIEFNIHDSIGIDLVAMCVNDLIVNGAEPLFFLDYYATSKLNVDIAQAVISGICKGCELSNCSLIGGETAEMPRIYQKGDYDLAGFCVGVVEDGEQITGRTISVGDKIIGIPSTGIHSNGYSLVHSIIEKDNKLLDEVAGNKTIKTWLIEPTAIYTKTILDLKKTITIKGLAHITGGGLLENIPRILPEHVSAEINSNNWQKPAIFSWLQAHGNIEDNEMWRVFNQGIGMVVIVDPNQEELVLEHLKSSHANTIGSIVANNQEGEATITINF